MEHVSRATLPTALATQATLEIVAKTPLILVWAKLAILMELAPWECALARVDIPAIRAKTLPTPLAWMGFKIKERLESIVVDLAQLAQLTLGALTIGLRAL